MNSEFAICVHALVYLDQKAACLSSEELAENICTNAARIRKVLGKLKKAGILSTKEGIGGGYQVEKDIRDITLGDLCKILDVEPVKATWKSGSLDMECMVASGMSTVMDDIYGKMNELCGDYLNTISVFDISHKIFMPKPKQNG